MNSNRKDKALSAPLLTDEMRKSTRKIHDISDKLVNFKLLVALTDNELYGRAILLFYYVYAQLELSLEACKDQPPYCEMQDILSVFARAGPIANDLKHYLGENWAKEYKPTTAVKEYVKRLKEIEKSNPTLLVPYCYHMYMAMLAGGQMIKKIVKKSLQPPENAGLDAFEFNTKSRMELRKAFKNKLNSMKYDEATKKLILEESIRVFKMNNEVVRSLDASWRQFALWLLKWIIAFWLIFLTYYFSYIKQ